jgi:hypothetical protein
MTDISSQTLHIVAKELARRSTMRAPRSKPMPSARPTDQLLEKCADQLHSRARRPAAGRGLRRGAARRGDGARHALPARRRQRSEAAGRRSRCADARHGAAADLPRARAVRRPRSGAGAAAAAQRSALGARQPLLSEGHAAAAQSEVRSAGAAAAAAPGRAADSPWRNGRGACGRGSKSGLLGYIRGERTVQNLEIWRRWPRSSSRSRPPSRCSSCGGWSAPSSRRCAPTAWKAAPR